MKINELEAANKETAIIAADVHLLKKPGMWSGRSEIAGDDVFALQQIAELTKEYDADLYLLGDTLDSVTNLPRPVIVVQAVLEPLIADGHSVRYLQGQHEIVVQAHYENYPWLSVCRGAEHIHGCTFDFFGRRAFALDYFPPVFEALNLSFIPEDTEVLFLHGTAMEVHGIGFHFAMENVPSHVKTIFAGDYHEATGHELNGTKLCYPGSAWMRSVSEPLDKSVLKVTKEGDNIQVERIPLKTRTILKYSNMDEQQKAEGVAIDESLPETMRRPLVIVDTPIVEDEYSRLAEHFHVYTAGSKVSEKLFEYINSGDTKSDEDILSQYVDKEGFESQFAFTLDVIQSSVGDAVQRLKERLNITTDDVTVDESESDNTEINLDYDGEGDEDL